MRRRALLIAHVVETQAEASVAERRRWRVQQDALPTALLCWVDDPETGANGQTTISPGRGGALVHIPGSNTTPLRGAKR